jgi:mono/diheme cytochrome c family protein
MSEHKPQKTVKPPKAFGWMAEYADENQLLDAARTVRDSGYTRTDAFTPFPVHGIDEALGIKPTVLPWITLCAGFTGITIALVMQWWMNAYDYPYIISGKPFASWPAFIPVAFELTVLFSAFTTVFAMLGLNGLPRFSNPVFTNPKFDRTTDDRFFLWIDSRDKYFNSDKVKSLLESSGALGVEEVVEDDSPSEIPKGIIVTILTLILITLIPGAIVLNMRNSKSGGSRFHVFFDMDFQPKRKTQTPTTIFADGRVQRPPVPGTIARGDLGLTDPYTLGYDPFATAGLPVGVAGANRLVSFQQDGQVAKPDEGNPPSPAVVDQGAPAAQAESPAQEKPAQEKPAEEKPVEAKPAEEKPAEEKPTEEKPAEDSGLPVTEPQATEPTEADAAATEPADMAASGEPNYAWVTEFPLPVDDALFDLGKRKFEQNCSACHGYGGYGDGLVSQRALNLAQGYWLQPTSLHDQRILEQPVGRIYYTIANGKGKMGGYGASLNPKERWAVVLYVRALQRSQNALESDVPAGVNLTSTDAQ